MGLVANMVRQFEMPMLLGSRSRNRKGNGGKAGHARKDHLQHASDAMDPDVGPSMLVYSEESGGQIALSDPKTPRMFNVCPSRNPMVPVTVQDQFVNFMGIPNPAASPLPAARRNFFPTWLWKVLLALVLLAIVSFLAFFYSSLTIMITSGVPVCLKQPQQHSSWLQSLQSTYWTPNCREKTPLEIFFVEFGDSLYSLFYDLPDNSDLGWNEWILVQVGTHQAPRKLTKLGSLVVSGYTSCQSFASDFSSTISSGVMLVRESVQSHLPGNVNLSPPVSSKQAGSFSFFFS